MPTTWTGVLREYFPGSGELHQSLLWDIRWYRPTGKKHPKTSNLHVVKFYFATPTMDIITKDLKANFMSKISTIGETLLL